jgi:hypothetical protein
MLLAMPRLVRMMSPAFLLTFLLTLLLWLAMLLLKALQPRWPPLLPCLLLLPLPPLLGSVCRPLLLALRLLHLMQQLLPLLPGMPLPLLVFPGLQCLQLLPPRRRCHHSFFMLLHVLSEQAAHASGLNNIVALMLRQVRRKHNLQLSQGWLGHAAAKAHVSILSCCQGWRTGRAVEEGGA